MSNIIFIEDADILNLPIQVIVQQCNCVSSNYKGLAEDILKKYDYANFYESNNSKRKIGNVELRGNGIDKRYIMAFYAQKFPGKPKEGDDEKQRLKWFEECFTHLKRFKGIKRIAFPYKIGCGLAGGDWSKYLGLLEQFATENKHIKVYIVSREGKNKMNIYNYLYKYKLIPIGWKKFFLENKGLLKIISDKLDEENKIIFPDIVDVFKIFHLIKPQNIKVIILGQDPYIEKGQATGVAFSVPKGVIPPPSLKNIFREIINSGYKVNGGVYEGDLTRWCLQGVFLINTALTVIEKQSFSHKDIWVKFTENLLTFINETRKNIVVSLWGSSSAWKYEKNFTNQIILKTSHPSPLGANKGFLGSKIFYEINKKLKENGKEEINWE